MNYCSVDTANRLRELGLKHEPEEGDGYSFGHGLPHLLNHRELWMVTDKSTWHPRLDQVLEEIERLVPDDNVTIEFFHREGGQRRYCAVLRHHQTYADILGDGTGPHDTEAAGLALAKIREARYEGGT